MYADKTTQHTWEQQKLTSSQTDEPRVIQPLPEGEYTIETLELCDPGSVRPSTTALYESCPSSSPVRRLSATELSPAETGARLLQLAYILMDRHGRQIAKVRVELCSLNASFGDRNCRIPTDCVVRRLRAGAGGEGFAQFGLFFCSSQDA